MKKRISFALTTLMTMNAMAAMNISTARGEKTTTFKSPHGRTEVCIIPQKLFPKGFSKGDLEDEAKLCEIDFYANNVICAKQNSTNPGLLIGDLIDGLTKDQAEAKLCEGPRDAFKTEAKFKQSISCSYTPSILAYYQFSRMLDAGNVPAAVIRTMDTQEHSKHTALALSYKSLEPTMRSTWGSFSKAHANGTNTAIFDSTGQFVYGSLVDNVKKEERYTEVSGRGSYDTRYQRFLQQPPFLRVANGNSVEVIAGGNTLEKVAQTVVQMKDVSDMILLDTLFSQDDRIGNIHYKYAWYFVDDKGKVNSKKSKAEIKEGKLVVPAEETAKYASGVLVRQMIMKDNDCGVDVTKRSNMMRKISAIEQVRHMSAKTYARLMSFAKIAKTPDVESYMQRELLFTSADLKGPGPSFQNNLDRAVKVLTENCQKGLLKLDLNIEDYAPGATKTTVACDGSEVK
ncbi:MAG: hypothetical protein J7501_04435 [Bdellovibrio sp.]|nr:hypothetical protein [Bdellovibrio sp.]